MFSISATELLLLLVLGATAYIPFAPLGTGKFPAVQRWLRGLLLCAVAAVLLTPADPVSTLLVTLVGALGIWYGWRTAPATDLA